MIPPLPPGQVFEQPNMVGWKNTFNMRQVTLMNLAASQIGNKNGVRSKYKSIMKTDCMAGPAKSLDLLRKNLQSAINKDIDNVLKKYLDKFFQPAISNIRNNLGRDSVTDDHINVVCRHMLEEAKSMYRSTNSRDCSPFNDSDLDLLENGIIVKEQRKRKESETDLETSNLFKRNKFKPTFILENHLNRRPVRREGSKWDSTRISQNTLFIMCTKAHKALGLNLTRGKLYVKHPEIFKYSGDQEDRDWLAAKNLLPPNSGKANIMLLEDVRELSHLEEYKNNPNLQLHELVGFEAPPFLLNKIRNFMDNMRTDKKVSTLDLFDLHLNSIASSIDSTPSTPSDTLQMLEFHSLSTSSSKHSDNNFIHIPEISPGSNNSLLNENSLQIHSSLLSPTMLMNIASSDNNGSVMVLPDNLQNGTCLSSLLVNQLCGESQEI